MADFSIGEAVAVGPGLIRRHPLAVLAWGILPLVVFLPLLLLFGGVLVAMIVQIVQLSRSAGEQPDPAALRALFASMGGLLLFGLLVGLSSWVLRAVITAAAYRAVLQPEQSSFFYVRFGAAELWLMLVAFVQGLVLAGVGIVLSIPSSIIVLAASAGGDRGTAAVLNLALLAVREAVTLYVWLRLCLGTPMTFADRQFRLFESWGATRGHVLKLFMVGVLIVLIAGAIELVALALGIGGLVLTPGAMAALQAGPQAFAANPSALIGVFAPALIEWVVLAALTQGPVTAVMRAPLAHIYRSLQGTDVSSTFA
ncbi:MAG TPA: hypothetical protein VKU90_14150 [Caulobacteraceae bacterium]|nr:hypothetical protein [Caulobacteraceae bacterium]